MKKIISLLLVSSILVFQSCEKINEQEEFDSVSKEIELKKSLSQTVDFQYRSTINVGGEGASEISAYDPKSERLFVVNVASNQISVYNLSDIDSPIEESAISLIGTPNSVAVHNGHLAIAVEAPVKQNPGSILLYDTQSLALVNSFIVGALPDMVIFSPNGKFIVSANEGEPNDDYIIDPVGTISIINVHTSEAHTLDFSSFNGQELTLTENGLRIFGPNATLAQDLEPEYVAISDNSNYAWVTLQENNGIAKVNLETAQIENIYPLGYKDYELEGNSIDASDRDDIKFLRNWPVYGMYQPDALKYVKIQGVEYLITANEGDARDYAGFSEEKRIEDLNLDPDVFPDYEILQQKENLGRLVVTTTLGDKNSDGLYEELYSFGARSFSVWSSDIQLLYDSGNSIAETTLSLTPGRFNDDDGRSDAKGAEPESVEVLKTTGNKHILFIGLERNDQILVYDISDPLSPVFLTILSHSGDEAPEGLLAIPGKDSPTKRDLLIVSNEDSGTVSIYENIN